MDNAWNWPAERGDLFPQVVNIQVPLLDPNIEDTVVWKSKEGKEVKFSVKQVYEDISN